MGSARETRHAGKASHGGHRGHRGGNWDWWRKLFGNIGASGARTTRMGKASHRGHRGHRGDWDWWRKLFGGRQGFRCEDHANAESIARRPQRLQRGIGIGGQSASVNTGASGARTTRMGKASHGGHRGYRGGLGLVAKVLRWTPDFRGENHANGESIAQRPQRSQRGIGNPVGGS